MLKSSPYKNIIALFAGAILLVTTAYAQDPTYLAEYKLYAAAMQNGDVDAAATHARSAWQAAETELGDHQTTGVLAFNYGRLMIFSNANEALPALQRAQALQKAGVSQLSAADLNMLVAYAEFVISDKKTEQAQNLRLSLEALSTPSAYSAIIWSELSADDLLSKRYEDALNSAAKAERAIDMTMSNDYRRKAEVIIIAGAAHLLPPNRSLYDANNAHKEFERAIKLFPPQPNIANFDDILAHALAWNTASRSVLRGLGREKFLDETSSMEADESGQDIPEDDHQLFIAEKKSNEECGIEWKRFPPRYPHQASMKGYVGAAVIGYDIAATGMPKNIKLLAEVPGFYFGEASMKSVEKWRLKGPAPTDPSCRDNRLILYSYTR